MPRPRLHWHGLFAHLEEALMAVLLAAMTLVTFAQAVLRYGFNSGFVWSLEATSYAFGWLLLLGMGAGIRTNTHIAVDLAVRTLSPGLRKAAALVAVAVSLLYAGLLGYGAWVLVERLMALGNDARDIPVPRWTLLAVMPLTFVLLAWRLAEAGAAVWRGTRQGLGQQEEGMTTGNLPEDDWPEGNPSKDAPRPEGRTDQEVR
ncbi:MAG: TRAP transporter small permease [Pseudomonadota bacterium]